jgi:ABC-2 type transport system permease protein
MTAISAPPSHSVKSGNATPTLPHVMRAEWTKLRSVRSTQWTILAFFLMGLGLGALITWGNASDYSRHHDRNFDPINIALGGTIYLAVLAVVVLGALTVTSEYSTGGIRTSLTAVPNRLRFYAAKVVVFGGLSLLLALVGCLGAYFIAQPIFSHYGISASFGDPGVTRAVFGGVIYVALCGLFGMGLGFVIRNSPGAITAGIGLLLVVPLLSFLLPGTVGHAIARYFSSNAGAQIVSTRETGGNHIGPWMGLGVFVIWVLVPLIAGAVLIRRRDA